MRRRIKDKSETGKRLVGYEAVYFMFFGGHFSWGTVLGRRKSPSNGSHQISTNGWLFPTPSMKTRAAWPMSRRAWGASLSTPAPPIRITKQLPPPPLLLSPDAYRSIVTLPVVLLGLARRPKSGAFCKTRPPPRTPGFVSGRPFRVVFYGRNVSDWVPV